MKTLHVIDSDITFHNIYGSFLFHLAFFFSSRLNKTCFAPIQPAHEPIYYNHAFYLPPITSSMYLSLSIVNSAAASRSEVVVLEF